ncbi:MAG: tetratricopeptide repeat protein [Methylotenera sp.]|nr:tetratricopeptide repeat protein [Oligoflexia bacterium]
MKIETILGSKLNAEGYDLVDLVPIPAHGDRMVRIRTLQEALEDFENFQANSDGQTTSYLIQVRPTPAQPAAQPRQSEAQYPAFDPTCEDGPQCFVPQNQELAPITEDRLHDSIYLTDGKLNVAYLQQNADLLYSAGDYALAKNIFQTVLSTGEKSGHALFWIGRCHEAEGNPKDAQACFEESLTYQPAIHAYQHLAALLIRAKKDHEAAEVMQRALNLKDTAREIQFELHMAAGNCWMRAEKADKAEKHYRRALSIDPSADSIQANLGALYLQMGQTSEAKRFFQDAVASNARNEKALCGIASCFLAEGDKRQAHDYFAKSLDISLNNPTAVFHLVKCAYEIKSYASAARILEEYVQIAPVSGNLLYSLAGLQFHLGRTGDARETANRILTMQKEHAGAKELIQMIETN